MMSEPKMPNGMSRRGFFASWPAVETASKPMYAKNTMVAARRIPLQPNSPGRPVGSGMKGCQLAVFTKNTPTAMKARITATLMATMMLLTVADSDTPITSNVVTANTTNTAGRFNTDETTCDAMTGTTEPAGSCTRAPSGATTEVPAGSERKSPLAGSSTLVTEASTAC